MANRRHWSASPLGLIPGWLVGYGLFAWMYHSPIWTYLLVGSLILGISVLFYLGASLLQKTHVGEAFRGAIIGFNSMLNGMILWQLTDSMALGWIACMVPSASAFLVLSRRGYYHALLGWVNWLLPFSWPVNLPGALMLIVNLIFAPVGYLHPLFRPLRINLYIDPLTSTITCYGGLIRPFKGFSGLNMGNFIFINPGWEHLLRHEIGHLFSLAAMGAPFHYIGGVDEALLQKNYWEAYAEYLAESYNTPGPTVLSVWK